MHRSKPGKEQPVPTTEREQRATDRSVDAPAAALSQRLRAVLRLRELVLDGELGHGERVSELPLAARLGVSRTPLRLALGQLEHEGLLATLPTGGYVVRSFTLADVGDSIAVRGALEGTAARMAAERVGKPRELEAMYGCVGQLDAVLGSENLGIAEFDRYVELNERFHALLIELARSDVLRDSIAHACAKPFASPSAFVQVQAVLPESHEILREAQRQHREILAAIERGDGGRAESVARRHALLARGNLDVALAGHGALDRVPGGALIHLPEAS
jgi:GntR family transcriptional regulator, vanillate catabolism transcriptional regulator